MEIKSNASTDLRPEGARLMDASLVKIDIPQFIKQLKTEVTWKNSDRNAITVFKTNGMCIVLIALHQGAVMKEHSAEEIMSLEVLEGEMNFNTSNESFKLKSGDMIALHAKLSHSVKAIEESVFLLTLSGSMEA